MIIPSALGQLSDQDLLARIQVATQAERQATAHLIALLMELDGRRLYLGEGFSSLFTYCTHALHLSEHAAYNRIETARAARRFPIILDLIAAGEVTLTAIRLLAPHLTPDNHHDVLARARHKGKREVELLVAALHPLPMCRRPSENCPRVARRRLRRQGPESGSWLQGPKRQYPPRRPRHDRWT